MLIARSLPALLLPSLTSQTYTTATLLRSPCTVPTLNRSTNLANLPAPPLGIYSSSFSTSSSNRTMGSDSSKDSPAGNFPKAKSDEEWRTVLSPPQVRSLFF